MVTVEQLKINELKNLRNCVILLQDYEINFDNGKKTGKEIVDDYLKELKTNLQKNHGAIFVAKTNHDIIGFISGWVEKESSDQKQPLFYISDLFVVETYRGRGIGKSLFSSMEQYIQSLKIRNLRVGVLDNNHRAKRFYKNVGFHSYELVLRKTLREK